MTIPSADELRTLQIPEELAFLRAQNPTKVFGAESHGFRLHPPLSHAMAQSFEAHHRVSLPADYKAFVTEIGDGGAGPFYGVYELDTIEKGFLSALGVKSAPFPYTTDWNWPESRLDELWEKDDDGVLEKEYFTPVDGAIALCHEGCGILDWLVVTGPEAGHVWHDARSEYGGVHPWIDRNGERMTFARWYGAWLDAALRGKRFRICSREQCEERIRIDRILGWST